MGADTAKTTPLSASASRAGTLHYDVLKAQSLRAQYGTDGLATGRRGAGEGMEEVVPRTSPLPVPARS